MDCYISTPYRIGQRVISKLTGNIDIIDDVSEVINFPINSLCGDKIMLYRLKLCGSYLNGNQLRSSYYFIPDFE